MIPAKKKSAFHQAASSSSPQSQLPYARNSRANKLTKNFPDFSTRANSNCHAHGTRGPKSSQRISSISHSTANCHAHATRARMLTKNSLDSFLLLGPVIEGSLGSAALRVAPGDRPTWCTPSCRGCPSSPCMYAWMYVCMYVFTFYWMYSQL